MFGIKKKKKKEEVDPTPEHTDTMPTVPYRVLQSGLPFYSDPQCTRQVPGATIAILQALDPDDPMQELDIVPTLKEYQPGQYVTWTLNKERLWEECWYRNPETGKIERAWTLHVEFLGKVISERAVREDRERLQELERRLRQRRQ